MGHINAFISSRYSFAIGEANLRALGHCDRGLRRCLSVWFMSREARAYRKSSSDDKDGKSESTARMALLEPPSIHSHVHDVYARYQEKAVAQKAHRYESNRRAQPLNRGSLIGADETRGSQAQGRTEWPDRCCFLAAAIIRVWKRPRTCIPRSHDDAECWKRLRVHCCGRWSRHRRD